MKPDLRKLLGIHLWQVFHVKEVMIRVSGRKYPSETKIIRCQFGSKHIDFYWYEVEIID